MNKAIQNVLVPVVAAGTVFASGVAAHDYLPFVSTPYELSQQDPMLEGLASRTSRDVMDTQGRALASAILRHIPGDTNCSNSCAVGTMNRGALVPDTKQFKYEIFWLGPEDAIVDVIATEYTVPKPNVNVYGNKVYDMGNGSGVSIVFSLGSNALNNLKNAKASNKPILAKDLKAAINDPGTVISFEHVTDGGKYAVAQAYTSPKQVEWAELGPKNVKSVSENDTEYQARLREVLCEGFAALASVEVAERDYPQAVR